MSYFATPRPPTAVEHGRKTVSVAGNAEALIATETPCRNIHITALEQNKDIVVVGSVGVSAGTDATRTGVAIQGGETIVIEIDDVSKVYIDSVVSGEGVSFVYYY